MHNKFQQSVYYDVTYSDPSIVSPRMLRHIRDFYWAAGAKSESSSGKCALNNERWLFFFKFNIYFYFYFFWAGWAWKALALFLIGFLSFVHDGVIRRRNRDDRPKGTYFLYKAEHCMWHLFLRAPFQNGYDHQPANFIQII